MGGAAHPQLSPLPWGRHGYSRVWPRPPRWREHPHPIWQQVGPGPGPAALEAADGEVSVQEGSAASRLEGPRC